MSDNTNMIHAMNSAKSALESVEVDKRTEEYSVVLKKIEGFIERFCEHCIVRDYIDISLEKTILIEYCTKCMKTFS
jgi:hypothetical protein